MEIIDIAFQRQLCYTYYPFDHSVCYFSSNIWTFPIGRTKI